MHNAYKINPPVFRHLFYNTLNSISTDPFYSESNMAHLRRGIGALNAGKGVEHELIHADEWKKYGLMKWTGLCTGWAVKRLIFVWKRVTLCRNEKQMHRRHLQSFSQKRWKNFCKSYWHKAAHRHKIHSFTASQLHSFTASQLKARYVQINSQTIIHEFSQPIIRTERDYRLRAFFIACPTNWDNSIQKTWR